MPERDIALYLVTYSLVVTKAAIVGQSSELVKLAKQYKQCSMCLSKMSARHRAPNRD